MALRSYTSVQRAEASFASAEEDFVFHAQSPGIVPARGRTDRSPLQMDLDGWGDPRSRIIVSRIHPIPTKRNKAGPSTTNPTSTLMIEATSTAPAATSLAILASG